MSNIPDFDFDSDDVERELIEHPAPANDRTVSRRIALQVLYEFDCVNHKVGDVLDYQLQAYSNNRAIMTYTRQIVTGVVKNLEVMDVVLQEYAPEWPVNQVAIIDRNILRIALFELAIETRIPERVAIDEAVQLAVVFGGESSPRFVNGVLGGLLSERESIRKRLIGTEESTD